MTSPISAPHITFLASPLPTPQEYFPPSLARTMFVEDYTSEYGVPPEFWDGAAAIMGNSVAQWGQSYNPSKIRRLAQRAVNAHAAYVEQRRED
jgi:hypothetical protein